MPKPRRKDTPPKAIGRKVIPLNKDALEPKPARKHVRTGRPPGRPPFVLTALHIAQIEQLAGYGLTLPQLCSVIGVSENALTRKKEHKVAVYEALENGKSKAAAIIGKTLFEKAKGGDMTALIWLEKTRFGKSDRITQDLNVRAVSHEEALKLLD